MLVRPLIKTWVTPNHLTTLRLLAGLAGVAALADGSYRWTNVGALLFVLSNFLDHTDGELARMSGKTSRFGHAYDLACDVNPQRTPTLRPKGAGRHPPGVQDCFRPIFSTV